MADSRHREKIARIVVKPPKIYHFDGQLQGDGSTTNRVVIDDVVDDYIHKKYGEDAIIPNYIDPSNFEIRTIRERECVISIDRYWDPQTRENPYVIGTTRGPIPNYWYSLYNTMYYEEVPSVNTLLTDLVNRTSPLRAAVSLPVMVAELLEATSLLKLILNNAFTLVGSGYLQVNFGVNPFLSDLRALLNITQAIEHNIKELNSLMGKGGLSRAVDLYHDSRNFVEKDTYASTDFATVNTSDVLVDIDLKIWGSVRWFPRDTNQLPVDELERFNLAVKAALDLDDFSWGTLWEMIPFSWLIDYFANVGPKLDAINTLQDFVPKHVCIMREVNIRQTRQNFTMGASDMRVVRNGNYHYRNRSRKVHDVNSDLGVLSFSFMSYEQSLNLAALLTRLTKNYSDFTTVKVRR
jgi:hypothetical protein